MWNGNIFLNSCSNGKSIFRLEYTGCPQMKEKCVKIHWKEIFHKQLMSKIEGKILSLQKMLYLCYCLHKIKQKPLTLKVIKCPKIKFWPSLVINNNTIINNASQFLKTYQMNICFQWLAHLNRCGHAILI